MALKTPTIIRPKALLGSYVFLVKRPMAWPIGAVVPNATTNTQGLMLFLG